MKVLLVHLTFFVRLSIPSQHSRQELVTTLLMTSLIGAHGVDFSQSTVVVFINNKTCWKRALRSQLSAHRDCHYNHCKKTTLLHTQLLTRCREVHVIVILAVGRLAGLLTVTILRKSDSGCFLPLCCAQVFPCPHTCTDTIELSSCDGAT